MSNIPQTVDEHRAWWESQRPDIPYGHCWCGCGGITKFATTTHWPRCYVKDRPNRYLMGHQVRKGYDRYTIEDHGYKTPCWVWQGHRVDYGYGGCRYKGRTDLAHRAFYQMYYGPIPEDFTIDHLCRPYGGPTNCVNPDHLEPVTQAENVRRGRGTKLNYEKVEQMRVLYESGEHSWQVLGPMFGVSAMNAYKVVTYRIWR